MAKEFIKKIIEEIEDFFRPIFWLKENPLDLSNFFRHIGWHFNNLPNSDKKFNEIIFSIEKLASFTGKNSMELSDIKEMLEYSKSIFVDIGNFPGIPEIQINNNFEIQELSNDILNLLTIIYLQRKSMPLYNFLELCTIIQKYPIENIKDSTGNLLREKNIHPKIDFKRLLLILSDPKTILIENYLNNGFNDIDKTNSTAQALFEPIAHLLRALGLSATVGVGPYNEIVEGENSQINNVIHKARGILTLSTDWHDLQQNSGRGEFGISIGLVPVPEGGPGLFAMPFGQISFNHISENFQYILEINGATAPFLITKKGLSFLENNSDDNLTFVFCCKKLHDSRTLIGNTDGTRFELSNPIFIIYLASDDNSNEWGMSTIFSSNKLVVFPDFADGFLQEIIPENGLEADFDFSFNYSSDKGFHFGLSSDLTGEVRKNITIGIFQLQKISYGLFFDKDTIDFSLTTSVQVKLGPISIFFDNLGINFQTLFSKNGQGNLGLLDLNLDLVSPTGLSLSINAKAVKGGGFLRFDQEKGQYDGFLQLEFGGRISLTAIGLLQTRLPNGKKGYSFLIVITAGGFTPIQLGFGFMLTKVGGLLGIHRGVDSGQVRQALQTEGLNKVLFPEDPMANVGQIISNLRILFPPAPDQYVFGPMGEIVWGAPVMMRIRLGIFYEFPQANRLHILAQFKVGLPSLEMDDPLVVLNMDAAGLIDFNRGDLLVEAVLGKGSRLLWIDISGGMAMRLNWGDDPMFLLSVGGFNPRFKAPPGFPEVKRITFSLAKEEEEETPPVGYYPPASAKKPGTRLELQAYFALTSNTLQFGAHFDLYVSAWTFSIEGYLHFDALFQFSPFSFVVDFAGGICVKWFGYTLLQIHLEITLSGPTPFHAKGVAHFSICWGLIDISVSFDRDLTEGKDTPPLPPAVDPLSELQKAFGDARNWEGEWPERGQTQVTLREIVSDSDMILVHPEVQLQVRQRILPLGIELSCFGNRRLAGDRLFDIEVFDTKGKKLPFNGEAQDYFAMAQFVEGMANHEKLNRPSFEKKRAGVMMDASVAIFEEIQIEDIGFQTFIIQDNGMLEENDYILPGAKLEKQAQYGAAGLANLRRGPKIR